MDANYKQMAYDLLVAIVEAAFALPWLAEWRPLGHLLLAAISWLFDESEQDSKEIGYGRFFN